MQAVTKTSSKLGLQRFGKRRSGACLSRELSHISHSLRCKTSYLKIPWRLQSTRLISYFFNCFEIWQVAQQQYCPAPCQTSKRLDNFSIQPRSFETSRDLKMRRLITWWISSRRIKNANSIFSKEIQLTKGSNDSDKFHISPNSPAVVFVSFT